MCRRDETSRAGADGGGGSAPGRSVSDAGYLGDRELNPQEECALYFVTIKLRRIVSRSKFGLRREAIAGFGG